MILDIVRLHYTCERYKEYVEKPFACPNCGAVFYAKWYHLFGKRDVTLLMVKKVKLKCPQCKQVDMCTWKDE